MRSLFHYRQLNLAVILAVAVASAVLTGALMVGDSVRESLRALTLDRLGRIDDVLLTDHLIEDTLVTRLREDADLAGGADLQAAILMRGSATGDGTRASGVQINAVAPGFAGLYPAQADPSAATALADTANQPFAPALINAALARELAVTVGDAVVLSFETSADIHRDSVYGEKDVAEVIGKLRVTIAAIIADEGMGRFSLAAHQDTPRNIFVPLARMQRALRQPGRINALFISAPGAPPDRTRLDQLLQRHYSLADLKVRIKTGEDHFNLQSPSYFLHADLVEAARTVAADMGLTPQLSSVYLANGISTADRSVPYSLMAAAALPDALGDLHPGGDSAGPGHAGPGHAGPGHAGPGHAGPGQVLLNQWTADDLGVAPGDKVSIAYYQADAQEKLVEKTVDLEVAGILPMSGIAVDRTWAPDFPGIEAADDMLAWKAPFPMDASRIREKDENYWDTWRTAPKAFLSLESARQLWDGRFGFYTGIRLGAAAGLSLEETGERFERALRERLQPERAGLLLVALRADGIRASSGATDFSGLFLALSFFIVISAMLLVGLFFRLNVEKRASEAGILMAAGFPVKKVRRRFLREGLLLAAAGSGLGALGGFLYADLVMAGLRHWWFVGTTHLFFHFTPFSLAVGFAASVLVSLIAVYLTVRRIGKLPAVALIAGEVEGPLRRRGMRAKWVFRSCFLAALGLLAASFFVASPAGLFFGVGSLLLAAGLARLAQFLARPGRRLASGLVSMAARNMARQSGRSLVCVSLVACACYVIVAVGLYRHTGAVNPDDPKSGTGGFFLEARSDIPLPRPLENPNGWADLGLDDEEIAMLQATRVVSLRRRGGDDASCLNLYAPSQPALLALPDPGVLQNRFTFQSSQAKADQDPWSLLRQRFSDGAIPVIGDANSMMWILKLPLGGDLEITGDRGDKVVLRLVGMLQGSIFQSELLMAEAHFLAAFPDQSGYGAFLLASGREDRDGLSRHLETALSDYGFDAVATDAKIEAYHAIENTYITIFQLLGGLGLLLGTLGLGAIIYRNALERRGEFAAMRAFGFRKSRISKLLLAENAVLIVTGIVLGTATALISMAPNLAASHTDVSLSLLAGTLIGVFLVGICASIAAVRKTQSFPLLASLRAE